jgi:hypothetical protein
VLGERPWAAIHVHKTIAGLSKRTNLSQDVRAPVLDESPVLRALELPVVKEVTVAVTSVILSV